MKRVSIRTLALMVELLLTVAAYQYLSSANKPAQADTVWLAGHSSAVQQIQSDCTGRP